MKSVFLICFILFLVCCSGRNEYNNLNFAPVHFPNIKEVNKYLKKHIKNYSISYYSVLDKINDHFKSYEEYGLMGYNWYGGILLADLNNDKIYELYLNSSTGSGFIHNFIQGFDPINEEYYILSRRMDTDYNLFVYNNDLYIWATSGMYSKNDKMEINIYKPKIINKEFILEDIDEIIYNRIIDEKTNATIYNPFRGNLTKDNIL
jgi:hypothetical protein